MGRFDDLGLRAVAAGVLRALVLLPALLAACGTAPPSAPKADAASNPSGSASAGAAVSSGAADWPAPQPEAQARVVGAHPEMLVVLPAEGDSWRGLAMRFLGRPDLAWALAQANEAVDEPHAGQPVKVPRQPPAPWGVAGDELQTVTILCYHRFVASDAASSNRMTLPVSRFEAQLAWLSRERYRVLRLADLQGFLQGLEPLPTRSVVITIDDGWESFYRLAFPLLQKYRMPATLFVYTDFIGTRDGLSWAQLREMAQSGLVDIQAHSKSHRNLAERASSESEADYRRALMTEARQPRQLLESHLADVGVKVRYFAYPYGDSNDHVWSALVSEGYELAFSVRAGGNAFYAAPHRLRRTMIYADHTLDDFVARVQVRRPLAKP